MEEEWKTIQGWPDYLVSNFGRVWSKKRNRLLKAGGSPHRYPQITLTGPDGYKSTTVHLLVAHAFLDGYFDGAFVNHIDGSKNNNVVSNLEWVTHAANMRHASEMGLSTGAGGKRKFTEEEWEEELRNRATVLRRLEPPHNVPRAKYRPEGHTDT